jgi:hypothetical protein
MIRTLSWSLLVVAALCQAAAADFRVAGAVHGTVRSYDYPTGGPSSRHGFGPGLAFDLLTRASPSGVAFGAHLGWNIYNQDEDNLAAHAWYQLFQFHMFVEKRFSGGAIGFGGGVDFVHERHYSIDGNYSYSNKHMMIAINAQLVIDVLNTRSGTLGVVAGIGLYPLIDLIGILSGEPDVEWRSITGSLGASYQF